MTINNAEPMPTPPPEMHPAGSSAALVAVAWLVVAVPLGWGVAQTIIKSLDLFRAPQHAGVTVTVPPSPQRGLAPPGPGTR